MLRNGNGLALMYGWVLATTLGCSGAPVRSRAPEEVSPEKQAYATEQQLSQELQRFAQASKNGLTEASCDELARAFRAVSERHEKATGQAHPIALYNAGIVLEHCDNEDGALSAFREAQGADPSFGPARLRVTLLEYAKAPNPSRTIPELESIVEASRYQNLEALVALATLQAQRNEPHAGQGCSNDEECARRNLQRALAIRDDYMPAINQLALTYLGRAKRQAGRSDDGFLTFGQRPTALNGQQLELAALVASQGTAKDPNYAPLYNTAGLVLVEMGDYTQASKMFARARTLDPDLVEAHLNYASVNLAYRGFTEAEHGYRAALALAPDSYEARVGLALALKGRLGGDEDEVAYRAIASLLEDAAAQDPERPEAYYNRALLSQGYEARYHDQERGLTRARELLRQFLAKTMGEPRYAATSNNARERIEDIEETMRFNHSTAVQGENQALDTRTQ